MTKQKPYTKKPKIALIVDIRNWAFHNIAKQIVKNLSDDYEFEIITAASNRHVNRIFARLKDFDLALFFYRELLNRLKSDYSRYPLEQMKLDYRAFEESISSCKIITCVSGHTFLAPEDIEERVALFETKCDSYYTLSKKLFDIYSNIEEYRDPWGYIGDGVDLGVFEPANLDRFVTRNRKEFLVGWVGNSDCWKGHGWEDLKGVHTVLNPAIDELVKDGHQIKRRYADKADRQLPHEEMPFYYSSIDVYVCASEVEGTPNPVLEAMACGVPVISTDVGIVPEVFGDKQKEFILKERCKDELKEKLVTLIENPEMLEVLSRENLKQIQTWDWKNKCQEYKRLFDDCLNQE